MQYPLPVNVDENYNKMTYVIVYFLSFSR